MSGVSKRLLGEFIIFYAVSIREESANTDCP